MIFGFLMLAKFGLHELTLGNNLYSFSTFQLKPLNLKIRYSFPNLFYVKIYIYTIQLADILAPNSVFFPFLLLLLDAYQVDLNLLSYHLFVVLCYPTSIIVDAKFHINPTMFYIV